MALVKDLINNAKVAFTSAQKNYTLIEQGVTECSKSVRFLNHALKSASTNSERYRFINGINLVEGYRTLLKKLRLVTGAGLSKRANLASNRVKWEDVQSAFNGRIRTGVIINLNHKDPKEFLNECAALFRRRINNALKKDGYIKVNTVFCCEFKIIKADEEIFEFKYMNTKNVPIYGDTNINTWFKQNVEEPILKKMEEFQEKDSGWTLSSIINLAVNINKFTPQLGSSYIELPQQIRIKKACVNVQNVDNNCFAWAVVSALYPVAKDPQRVTKYPHYSDVLNLGDIVFPMTTKQIPRFEKQNNLSVNVYILMQMKKDNFKVLPIYLTNEKKEKHINLLMIQNEYYDEEDENKYAYKEEEEPIKYHFVWIKNLSRLLSSQMSKNAHQKFFCDRCLHYFYSSAALERHLEDCKQLNNCRIRLPTQHQKELRFKNFSNKVEAPFVIYADLECLLVECSDRNKYQEHVPCSVGFYVKCSYDPTLSFFKCYRGDDCIEWFVRELNQFAENLEKVFLCPLSMDQMTEEQLNNFSTATFCHICEKVFTTSDKKVRDHCHLTGKYRGPAHEGCNINFKDNHTVPVIFHNLSGYDSHFILKNIASDLQGRVDLLPINKERYISFTKHLVEYPIKFRFIDSLRFMASSLDTLSTYLTSFPILKSQFQNLSDNQLNLLARKGVYPYDYFDSKDRFFETSLPPVSKFYNKLNDCDISQEDYTHACNVWSQFNIQSLGEYSDLYLKTDVLLLADVFEQFRASCRKTYGLDPAHYYTLPGYTWDAMLKHTDVTLELLTDVDMLMFVERGIRGGLSQCSKRYSKANNKYYVADYDSTKPSKFIQYYDVNNQYGWAMSQLLPHSGFKWVENVNSFKVEDVPDDSLTGYILEVDLEYPQEIHDLHKDLPFCPEHRPPSGSTQNKLLATLENKTKYVLHYRNLKQALLHGLKLTKIHKILQFNQSTWLKSYIDLNTRLRTLAKNDFEKNLFKLMNNAVFGKTMENVRKHSIVKLVTKWMGRYGAEAHISKPEFKASTIFNESLVAIELNKTEVYFNKPIYVGMCILDLSKTAIYDFHYSYMIPQFNSDCTVCYTDTDSLIYEITCPDLYEIIKRDCHTHFDTSDYPPNNIWNIPLVNKKVLGFMKDENNGSIMTEFVGLRSKMYAIRVEGKDKTKKSKGIKRNIVKNRITFDDYVDCLNNNTEKLVYQNLIQSKKHKVSTITQTKIALSPHDDKRYLIPNSHETIPWGHYSIMDVR